MSKLRRGTKVYIKADLGKAKSHFPKDMNAIVEFSYRDIYGGNERQAAEYSVVLLTKEGEPYQSIAWYYEHELVVLETDLEKGMDLIDKYKEATG